MAGEILGKIYEAILHVVLSRLKRKGIFAGDIFWNQTPRGVTVEPDILLGQDVDHPSHIFCVTHSGSSKNSDMKTWRNLGELCEAKSVLTPTPRAINIAFESVWKEELEKVQVAAFDAQLFVDRKAYGQKLVMWVKNHVGIMPIDQEKKADEICKLSKSDTVLACCLKKLENDIKTCLFSKNVVLDDLWRLEKARPKRRAPKAKVTCIRRGLSKLLIFENIEKALTLFSAGRMRQIEVPTYAFSLGLAKKVIGHAVPSDTEIMQAVHMLKVDQIRFICGEALSLPTFQAMLSQVRSVESLRAVGCYLKAEYKNLAKPEEFYLRTIELHDNANALIDKNIPASWPPDDVWLVSYVIEIIKRSTKLANGYGLAQLALDVVEAGFGSRADLTDAGQFAGGFGFPAWLHRKKSPFRKDLVKGVSFVLSKKILEIGEKAIVKLIDSGEIETSYMSNLIEAKICTYRMFEPLYLLLQDEMPTLEKRSFRTCFAEKAGLRGTAGKTTVAVLGDVIINWQTGTDAGKDHKRKELCGRAVGLRYTWDAKAKRFKPRPGVKKLVLLLDGTWTQKDLNALVAAGWDEIYYPDEIDKLKASVFGTKGTKDGSLPKRLAKQTYEDEEMREAAEEAKAYGKNEDTKS